MNKLIVVYVFVFQFQPLYLHYELGEKSWRISAIDNLQK